MTISVMNVSARSECPRVKRPRSLFALIAGYLRRRRAQRETHRTLVRMARFPPHLIRDMGYDPETLYYALKDTRDEIAPIVAKRP